MSPVKKSNRGMAAPERSRIAQMVSVLQVGRGPRRLGKRQREQLQASLLAVALEELTALGAVPSERTWLDGELNIETKAGLLRCHPYTSVSGNGIWIALRFEDVDRANALINLKRKTCYPFDNGLNPFSGKWNIDSELIDCTDPDAIRRCIRRKFKNVMPETETRR